MLDRLEAGQGHSVFSFDQKQSGGNTYIVKNEKGEPVVSYTPSNDFTNLVVSSKELVEGEYSLWCGDTQLKVAKLEGNMGMRGGMPMGERPEGEPARSGGERKFPDGTHPVGEKPERIKQGEEMPDGMTPPDFAREEREPQGKTPTKEHFEKMKNERLNLEYAETFKIEKGANYFAVSM